VTPFAALPTVRFADGAMRIIDQTLLPLRHEVIELRTVDAVCEAIRSLRVRGAPAIGVAGAYGMLVAVEEKWPGDGPVFQSGIDDAGNDSPPFVRRVPLVEMKALRAFLDEAGKRIGSARPTAVNLPWAVSRMRRAIQDARTVDELLLQLVDEADAILAEDLAMGRDMTGNGATLIPAEGAVLTHCNTGGLATGGVGTALGVVFAACANGSHVRVYADETRPLLQGARLTAWECHQRGIPVTVLVEGAAASLLSSGKIQAVLVGADRIAANGDTANKVGTLGLAILADRYQVPFYVVAPSSTIDDTLPDGSGIPIEQRAPEEVSHFAGVVTVGEGADAFNPAFDVTPASLITAIVTERGIHRPPYQLKTR
jgi:methylthioribose-1-phosphate isomerase